MTPMPTISCTGMCAGKRVLREIGGIEGGQADDDLGKDQDARLGVGPEVEERQQRHDQEPHQERRTRAAIVVGAPQDRRTEIEHRQKRERRVVARKCLQGDRKQPERADRRCQDENVRPGLRIVEVQEERNRRAEHRSEEMAHQEHADTLLDMRVGLDRLGREPVDQHIQLAHQFHGPALPQRYRPNVRQIL